MKKWLIIFAGIIILVAVRPVSISQPKIDISPISPTPAATLQIPLPGKTLAGNYHVFQTFNNCGPAALSMAFSYYGIDVTQQTLGQELRPFQNPQGDNDDKSVTLDELAEKSKKFGLIPYHRPLGTPEIIKFFITYNIPVIARTLLNNDEDIGHYRVIKGYDDGTREFIQDDSLQGKNLRYSYADFDALWKKFNYEYLVLIPQDKKEIAEKILGENADFKTAWKNAVTAAQKEVNNNPQDIDARFNLSVALYNAGNFKQSVKEFEKIEKNLPFRTLWYQIEPILAYFESGDYNRVFEITDEILNTYNRAFSELYILRGKIYLKQGNKQAAQTEFEKAVFYNQNLPEAKGALNLL